MACMDCFRVIVSCSPPHVHQLAEKRKTLLDEMAIKGQESVGEQMRRVEGMEERYKVRGGRIEACMGGGGGGGGRGGGGERRGWGFFKNLIAKTQTPPLPPSPSLPPPPPPPHACLNPSSSYLVSFLH